MKKEEQRIAIAGTCGMFGFENRNGVLTGWFEIENPGVPIPDYLNDLNAMHEAEKVLTEEQWRKWEYIVAAMSLPRGSTPLSVCIARMSAAQRAEAFLKTLNLWTE
jgi:hypothetical protein